MVWGSGLGFGFRFRGSVSSSGLKVRIRAAVWVKVYVFLLGFRAICFHDQAFGFWALIIVFTIRLLVLGPDQV